MKFHYIVVMLLDRIELQLVGIEIKLQRIELQLHCIEDGFVRITIFDELRHRPGNDNIL